MITGLAFQDLARQVIDQSTQRRDFHVGSGKITFAVQGKRPVLRFDLNGQEVCGAMTDYAFRQITEFAGIPAKYVDRMMTNDLDDLVKRNVQAWLLQLAELRFVRALQNGNDITIRAFLSDRYKPLDNIDLLQAVSPALQQHGLVVHSSQVTEKRLYIQAVNESIHRAITQERGKHEIRNVSRLCSPGIVISNSEVGAGSLRIEPMIYDRYCTNGAIFGTSMRRYHIGRGTGGDGNDDASAFYSDETRQLTDAALWAQVRDVVSGALNEANFHAIMDKIDATTQIELPDAQKAVEITRERFGMTEDEKTALLNHLISGGENNLFGLYNAVTRTAQDSDSYDRAIELERFGGELIGVNASEVAKWVN